MRISVVTPSYNQGQFLRRTIESVIKQNYNDLEHLVFDGGSADNTVEVLRQYSNHVQWVSEKDGGQAHAINKGLRMATGDIIGWLNSDDIYYPGAIEKVTAVFDANPDVDIVYGQADHVDVNDRPFECYPTAEWDFDELKESCFICQPALFFRRRLIEHHGLLNESLHYCMDYEFWLRLGMGGVRFLYLPEKLAGSRLYPNNKTLGARIKVHHEINDMMKSLFDEVPDRWLFNYAHAVAESKHMDSKRPRRFVLRLLWLSFYAAMKWNGRVSPAMKKRLFSWYRQTGIFGRDHAAR